MVFAYKDQPLKGLYLAIHLSILLCVQIPYLTLKNLVPSWRPRSTWSFGRSLQVELAKRFVKIVFDTGLRTSRGPAPSASHGLPPSTPGFVGIAAAPKLVVGEVHDLAVNNGVSAEDVTGLWYPPLTPGEKPMDQKVIYHFHGGGFIMGSAAPESNSKTLYDGFVEIVSTKLRVFALEYRLASAAPYPLTNPFPAALIDAITGYNYLINERGVDPSDIILSGDSAGGNLAFALAYYLARYSLPDLPCPAGVLLLSPTVAWGNTNIGHGSSMQRNLHSDFVELFLLTEYTKRAMTGSLPSDWAARSAWISPGSLQLDMKPGLFAGMPRTCILAGGAEMTLDPMRTLRDRLIRSLGAEAVTYIEMADATHDWLTIDWHEPERTEAFHTIGEWMDSL